MIDIIIPLYNARETLELTLMSLDVQTMKKDIIVYLIDDASNETYEDIIKSFKDLKITYYRLDKNVGPALARQKGLDIGNNDYVMFLDSDDYLYKTDAIEILYKNIIEGYDYVIGITYDEKKGKYLFNEGDLHGKLYSKKFINEKNIKFNNSRFHEDNYFNNLFLACNPKTKKVEDCMYLYRYNKNSITNDEKDFERLELFLKNINQFLTEVENRETNKEMVIHLLVTKVLYFTSLYVTFDEEKRKTFEKWIKEYDLPFLEYIGRLDYDGVYKEMLEEYDK